MQSALASALSMDARAMNNARQRIRTGNPTSSHARHLVLGVPTVDSRTVGTDLIQRLGSTGTGVALIRATLETRNIFFTDTLFFW